MIIADALCTWEQVAPHFGRASFTQYEVITHGLKFNSSHPSQIQNLLKNFK
jgi:hypothetical protein